MSKLLTVIGTRPQFIKYATLAERLDQAFEHVVVDTGQHWDAGLSSDFLSEFQLRPPAHRIDANRAGPLVQLSGIIVELCEIIEARRPDALLCIGDTTSTLAAALAGNKTAVPIAHIEAGERNFTRDGRRVPPWHMPEETNRILTDQMSHVLLCASRRAEENLQEDRVHGAIVFTGDVMRELHEHRLTRILDESRIVERLGLDPGEFYFGTVHRALNTDNRGRLSSIFEAFLHLDRPLVVPLHPRTEKMLTEFDLLPALVESEDVHLLEPVSYQDSISLNYHSRRVITDSGGVMREAFFNGVPSVLLDDTTAWIDLVYSDWCTIAGADAARIIDACGRSIPDEKPSLFGEGSASEAIVEVLSEHMA